MTASLVFGCVLVTAIGFSSGYSSDPSVCSAIDSNDQSTSEATCQYCHEDKRVRNIFIASLSPSISASPYVHFEKLLYQVQNDPINHQTFKLLNVTADVTLASVTVYWTANPVEFSSKSCLPVQICTNDNLVEASLRSAENDSIVIFTHKLYAQDTHRDLIGSKRLIVGTLVGNSMSFNLVRTLVQLGGHVLSNLYLPPNLLKDNHQLKGNLFVFSPLKAATSTVQSSVEDSVNLSVNLAQLTVTNGDLGFCGKFIQQIQLHNAWTPTTSNFADFPRPFLDQTTNRFTFTDHYGTHVHFGSHFLPGGKLSGDKQPICDAIGPCVKVSALNYRPEDSIPLSVFLNWESRHNMKIPRMVFVETGCQQRNLKNPNDYMTSCPGISAEAIEFLLANRSVKVIGTDSALLDRPADRQKLLTQYAMSTLDAIGVVALSSSALEQLSESKQGICLLNYFRFDNGTGSPVAVVAFQLELPKWLGDLHRISPAALHSKKIEAATMVLCGITIFLLAVATFVIVLVSSLRDSRRLDRTQPSVMS